MKTKKFLSILLAVLMMFSVSSVSFAADVGKTVSDQVGDNVYRCYDSETQTLTISGTGDMWDIDEGYSGKYENIYSFGYGEEKIPVRRIVVQDGVTSIGARAFAEYGWLEEIELPDELEKVGDEAFINCVNIKTIDFKKTKSLGRACCKNCVSLEAANPYSWWKVVIPDEAFENCYSLVYTNLYTFDKVGNRAFKNCFALGSDGKNNAVQADTIGDEAYYGCVNVTYCGTTKDIGEMAFAFCLNMNNHFTYNGKIHEQRTVGQKAFLAVSFKEYAMQNMNCEIGDYAFGYTLAPEAIEYYKAYFELTGTVYRDYLKAYYTNDTANAERLLNQYNTEATQLKENLRASNPEVFDQNGEFKIIKDENMTLRGFKPSTIRKYAEENGIKHRPLEESSNYTDNIAEFGYCSHWRYFESSKKLQISAGEIYALDGNYYPDYPWNYLNDEIEELEIEYWFLWVAGNTFKDLKHIKKLSLVPDSSENEPGFYREVNDYAFANMTELETIIISEDSFSLFSDKAFAGCKNVKTVINKSPDVVVNLDEECKDNVMISCYNDSAQHQACIEQGISHITIDRDKPCGRNSNNPVERIRAFLMDVLESLRSFFEKLFKI